MSTTGGRIRNAERLTCHGNVAARKAMVAILEAGLEASDPYHNTRKLVCLRGNTLVVGGKAFEPSGDPHAGDAVYDLSTIRSIYVFGAGKGSQRMVRALEEILGDRITDGHVIDKRGHPIELQRIEVSLGDHPLPDQECVKGSQRILELTKGLTERDLVFTCISNGVSSALTLPVTGMSLEDVRKTTYVLQVERGAPTGDLNAIRNHIDLMKGGRIARHIQPAQAVHIFAHSPSTYDQLMYQNLWLHTLPDYTTFQLAASNLKKWNAWDDVPSAVREFITRADARYETVKAQEFEQWPVRIFGVMPGYKATGKLPPAMQKAEELGFRPILLTDELYYIEAPQAGRFLAAICKTIARSGQPFQPPCALFTSGETVVTVGKERGVGGRNQELVLAAAQEIAGQKNIVIGSVDTDGTDGPGGRFAEGEANIPACLAGGIVDSETANEARMANVDLARALKTHNTSEALWRLHGGVVALPSVSLVDLTVALVTA